MKKDYTYISSKMSGMPEYNFPAFKIKAKALRSRGYKIWNPADHNPKRCKTWTDFIRDDLSTLNKKCKGIYMFGSWYLSHGALVELIGSHRMGLDIEIEQWWLRPMQWILNATKRSYDEQEEETECQEAKKDVSS
jgi:hypothetical protein